ncbi:hypothetical protein BGX31_003210 [Mortierella sp. GBA43]|nr:hypothetical protein BGX31_003210 [Mortierella sp. GBA43]
MVLMDYNIEQLRQKRLDPGAEKTVVVYPQAGYSPTMPALIKYGPWIRTLPEPRSLQLCLQPQPSEITLSGSVQEPDAEPSACTLMRHLYKYCSALQVEKVFLNDQDLASEDLMTAIADYILPKARHLSLVSLDNPTSLRKLKYLLNHCSSMLEELTLAIDVVHDNNEEDEEQEQLESQPPTRIKKLGLWYCTDKSESKALWPWLWKQCAQVEGLQLGRVRDISNSLVNGMEAHMPYLQEIEFGAGSNTSPNVGPYATFEMTDNELGELLSGSCKGWKTVKLGNSGRSGEATKEALLKHLSTLERLELDSQFEGFTAHDRIQMFACCPNLRALVTIDYHNKWNVHCAGFKAEEFIDRDPNTGLLNPWACERSLRELTIQIAGIPRHDLWPNESAIQGQKLQDQVYDRLARLTSLEILNLGNIGYSIACGGLCIHSHRVQSDCLEMSLESGLGKLAGLVNMRVLDVYFLKTRMGLTEVQWMVQHWPRLRSISGLYDKNAINWLDKNHPEIKVEKVSSLMASVMARGR